MSAGTAAVDHLGEAWTSGVQVLRGLLSQACNAWLKAGVSAGTAAVDHLGQAWPSGAVTRLSVCAPMMPGVPACSGHARIVHRHEADGAHEAHVLGIIENLTHECLVRLVHRVWVGQGGGRRVASR